MKHVVAVEVVTSKTYAIEVETDDDSKILAANNLKEAIRLVGINAMIVEEKETASTTTIKLNGEWIEE